MKETVSTARAGAWRRVFLLCIAVVTILWMAFGNSEPMMAQGGTPSAAAGGQAQPAGTAPAAGQAQPGVAPTTAAASGAAQTKETGAYIVGKWWSFVIAIVCLIVVLLLTLLAKGKSGFNFFQSPDGAVSVSKVQVWMWTMTIIFAYVYLFLWHGPKDIQFPDSLWELMGISALSTGAARYIATVMGNPPALTDEAKQTIAKQNWLVSMLSDDGEPSMMRLQLFGWTLVTIFLFLVYVRRSQALWDVPTTLVILMGISHAGYLGDKGAAVSKT